MTKKVLHPIILIPGLGASVLQTRSKDSKFRNMWKFTWLPNTLLRSPNNIAQNLRLKYNYYRKVYKNAENIKVKPYKFGRVDGVRYLSKMFKNISMIYHKIIKRLERKLKYKANKNIYGAPYDFRILPYEKNLKKYFNSFDRLIKKAYLSHNKPVIIISHSMGSILMSRFLSSKTTFYKNKFINSWISISAPFGGSFKSFKSLIFGDLQGLPRFFVKLEKVQQTLSSFPSMYYLLPNNDGYGNRTIFKMNKIKYTVEDIPEILKLYEIKDYKQHLNNVDKTLLYDNINVKSLFIYSSGIKTMKSASICKSCPIHKYHLHYGDGDGTVSKRSLELCVRYLNKNPENVFIYHIQNVEHQEILSHEKSLDLIEEFVKERNQKY